MSEREAVLSSYRRWLGERWRKGHLTLDDVRALKIFAQVHQLTPEEHEAAAREVGVDRRELVDADNQHIADWLQARRQAPPAGAGSLRFAAPEASPWRRRLPAPPPSWQAALAWLAVVAAVAAAAAALLV